MKHSLYIYYFVPKPKWSSANELMLSEYRHILDLSLQNINLPDDPFTCRDVHCLLHRPVIERLHNDIIAALLNAAKCSIQFTTNKRHNNKSPRSGWKEHVAMYRAEAMNWHALWLSCGCPSEGYVFNMRKTTRSTYHK